MRRARSDCESVRNDPPMPTTLTVTALLPPPSIFLHCRRRWALNQDAARFIIDLAKPGVEW
jgi:hypothetical protein